ncbi:MAG TPA: sugar phosphate isomerase/epimerase family protein [Rectinemataceae bacterium]|nr:sugar phosphate isomerase/epimerase family protein [Rectinemataceae bacterium]
MAIKVGCFALVDAFSVLEHQLERLQGLGVKYADVTDNADGACLGAEFGFTGLASLDANPHDIKRMFAEHGLTIMTYCAHASLLDPEAPWRYGTAQILKAVRAASMMGVKHVITTEGHAHTDFGRRLGEDEAIFTIRQKLFEPLRMAADCGIKILLETHGKYTDDLKQLERIIDACDSKALGLNLDTGNLWLGGGDPVAYVKKFASLIDHVHWKDWPKEMEARRGKEFGAGMSGIPLGTGVVNVKAAFKALMEIGYDGYSTLEIAGDEAIKQSYAYLRSLGAE